MGVRVADCRADEWSLCAATPELKERLVRRTGRKKSDWKWKTFPERQHSNRRPATPPAPHCAPIGPLIIPPLWLEEGSAVCPSLRRFHQGRGEILRRSGFSDSTVRPFRGSRRLALLDVLTRYIKQINNREESYCIVCSSFVFFFNRKELWSWTLSKKRNVGSLDGLSSLFKKMRWN